MIGVGIVKLSTVPTCRWRSYRAPATQLLLLLGQMASGMRRRCRQDARDDVQCLALQLRTSGVRGLSQQVPAVIDSRARCILGTTSTWYCDLQPA